jgi:hypothetical protein
MSANEKVHVTVEFTTDLARLIPFMGELQKAAVQRPELSGEVARSGAAPSVEPPARKPEDAGSSPAFPTKPKEQLDSQPKRLYNQGPKLRWRCMVCGELLLTKTEARGHSKKLPRHEHALEPL